MKNLITDLKKKGLQGGPIYTGIPTFLRMPMDNQLKNLDVALIGVPFDLGSAEGSGSRFAPQEIRIQSKKVGYYNHETKKTPLSTYRIADIGDVPIYNKLDLNKGIDEIEAFYQEIEKNKVVPISVGGDHSITYPILKALGRDKPLNLIHFDAHCDTDSDYHGERYYHGAVIRNAIESGFVNPNKTIQIGIRGSDEVHWGYSYEKNLNVIHIEEYYEKGITQIAKEIKRIVGDEPVYLSFDIDCLDPAYAPGTETPVVGGFTSYDAQHLIRKLSGINLVGADIVEVNPQSDSAHITTLTAATIMFEILCLVNTKPKNNS